jgi:uncharacterized protein YndB with AHSA1/START domain
MRQVTVSTFISAPREAVYDFIVDLAGRPAFTDHYLKDFRLARLNASGEGAAARFMLDTPLAREWGEIVITEADRPRRIVEEGRLGRLGRSRMLALYELVPEPGGTRVELTTLSDPTAVADRLKQVGVHRWIRRQTKIALERLRQIFEEPPQGELTRASVAGYDALKSPRFGAPVGSDPSRSGRTPAGG